MVVYDFSIHLIFLFGKEGFFIKQHLNYWPEWEDKNISKKRYQQFWTAFWGIAVILLLIYIIDK